MAIVMKRILASFCYSFLLASLYAATPALAAKGFSSASQQGEGRTSHVANEMMVDLTLNYVRDTSSNGTSDTAAKFSLGGMFNSYIGLDAVGLFEVHSKNYLVGTDIRVTPVDWMFVKAGVGGYADRVSRQLAFTPLASTGIIAHFDRDLYFVTEASYFQVNSSSNLSLGAGLGLTF